MLFARAVATLVLGAAVLALGCGGGSDDDTTSDRGPAAEGAAEGPGKDAGRERGGQGDRRRGPGAPQGGTGPFSKRRAAVRDCLERHGVELPARGGDQGEAGDVLARINELRSAAQKCREELPKGLQAGGAPPRQFRQFQRRARRNAARQARGFAEFRACMGRHGFGPEADEGGNAPRGDLRKAFKRCGPPRARPAG
jgi:hypothetical protein